MGQLHALQQILFDHLVGEQLHRIGDRDAQRLRGRHIDHKFEFGRLIDWQFGRFFASENSADVDGSFPIDIRNVVPIAHQGARRGPIPIESNDRYCDPCGQRNNLMASAAQKGVARDYQRACSFPNKRGECRFDLVLSGGIDDKQRLLENLGGSACIFRLRNEFRTVRVYQQRDGRDVWNEVVQTAPTLLPSVRN